MSKTKDLNLFLPEDLSSRHISTFNKSALKMYLASLRSASNEESSILYHNFWRNHDVLFNNDTRDLLSDTVDILLQNSSNNNCNSWRSSGEDVSSLLVKSLPECSNCKNEFENESEQLKMFLKKDVMSNTSNSNENYNNVTLTSLSKPTNNLHNTGSARHHTTFKGRCSINDETSDLKQVFNPKFGITKSLKDQPSSSKDYPAIDDNIIVLDKEEEEERAHRSNVAKITFKTAKQQLLATNPAIKRTLGASRKASARFVSPMLGAQDKQEAESDSPPQIVDDRLKHLDPKMIELIESEIIDKGTPIGWDDIAGLQLAKSVIQEAVVWPLLRPDIFTGLRRPPKGVLLFGPPGTGKTLIGKCVAAQCHATFFSISASSLTSKWLGDGEKMVRALFAVARCHQPAVIFIDEIDSLLTQRSDSEHEATRRIKTEFLVQFDGAATAEEDRILVVGATNRPHELDEAARRRLVKRLYIPLPDAPARKQIISNLLKAELNDLSAEDIGQVAALTEGYSGADVQNVCSEAAMGPIRSVPLSQIATIQRDKVRPVSLQDFVNALERIRPSVSQDDLGQYVKWNKTYGQGV